MLETRPEVRIKLIIAFNCFSQHLVYLEFHFQRNTKNLTCYYGHKTICTAPN